MGVCSFESATPEAPGSGFLDLNAARCVARGIVSQGPPREALLAQALELLQSYVAQGGSHADAWDELSHGGLHAPPDSWLTSATDLIVPWSPEMLSIGAPEEGAHVGSGHGAGAWDDYLQHFEGVSAGAAPAVRADRRALERGSKIEVPVGSFAPQAGAPPAEAIDDDSAEAAVECLYDFLHALARRDVSGALAFVAQDYHVMENDLEVDRGGLRRQIEAFLDTRIVGELAVSLARVPEPVAHPLGVLVRATMQIDYSGSAGRDKETTVLERIAVIGEAPDTGWKLLALCTVESDEL